MAWQPPQAAAPCDGTACLLEALFMACHKHCTQSPIHTSPCIYKPAVLAAEQPCCSRPAGHYACQRPFCYYRRNKPPPGRRSFLWAATSCMRFLNAATASSSPS